MLKDEIDYKEKKYHELGLYIHIPFCVKKCNYCDFLSGPADEATKQNYFEALANEIKSYEDRTEVYQVSTVFIGGGTPSSVDAVYIKNILDLVKMIFAVKKDPEITIEINPGTLGVGQGHINKEKLLLYKEAGINRISFGLQSTEEKYLKLLGRIHSYDDFEKNYLLARELGFENINVDLMSALPGQTLSDWEETLKKVLGLKPEHISAYSLIIEEGTNFYERYSEGKELASQLPDEDTDRLMYQRTKEILKEYGYQRYEISNYAKPGFECKHNLTYWIGTEYLGLGLGSASLLKKVRFHNAEDINEYLELCNNGRNYDYTNSEKRLNSENIKLADDSKENFLRDILDIRREVEPLSKEQQMEEFMFLGLRVLEGVSRKNFFERFQVELEEVYKSVLDKLMKQKLLAEREDRIYLTDYGIDISNAVLAEFLLD